MIFLGALTELVKILSSSVPTLFRGPIPVFMPVEHQDIVKLRLDSNIIFFEENQSAYTLEDRYAIKGSDQIAQKFGSWSKQTGMRLIESTLRWSRRRDLQGRDVPLRLFGISVYSYVSCVNAIERKQLQLHTFASSCYSVTPCLGRPICLTDVVPLG